MNDAGLAGTVSSIASNMRPHEGGAMGRAEPRALPDARPEGAEPQSRGEVRTGFGAEDLAIMPPGPHVAVLLEALLDGALRSGGSLFEGAHGLGTSTWGGTSGPASLPTASALAVEDGALLSAVGAAMTGPRASVGADALGKLGADVLSELVAACGRLVAWAQRAQAIAAACLARSPEMCPGPPPWLPNDAASVVPPEASRFTAASEIACRLGVSRTTAGRLVDRGEALLDQRYAPAERLHRAGLLDSSKTDLVIRRLQGEPAEVVRAVQDEVLDRAPQRSVSQLARDIDRALAAHDPDGLSRRRQRDTASRHVSRPRPAGTGVHEMRLLMATPDAFLVDATLDAMAASARAAGDGRLRSQLRADALLGMTLTTLRGAQEAALKGADTASSTHVPTAAHVHRADALTAAHPATADATMPARPRRADATVHWAEDEALSQGSEHARRMPDEVPLQGLLTALGDVVGSTDPWWSPSGLRPVLPRAGLSVHVDVTVPLNDLVACLGTESGTAATASTGHEGAGHDDEENRQSGHGGGARSPVVATVTIGANSAPVPAAIARALAAGGTWRRLVTDPLSGTVIDVGRRHYRPPAALADLVRARDRSCTHPGCHIPALRCDLDHVHPWSGGGTTSLKNLTSLCEAHHRLKHTPGWSLTRSADGTLIWRTPTGARYRRDPDGTITRLSRRVGTRGRILPAVRIPPEIAEAVSGPILERLRRGIEQYEAGRCEPALDTCENTDQPRDQLQGQPQARLQGQGRLETYGPAPGERPGDFEVVPYPQELHDLGLSALLDAVAPF